MTARAYFWTGTEVVMDNLEDWDVPLKYGDMFCLDTKYSGPRHRYGVFPKGNLQWVHHPLAYFPKEFRVHLLLLGVAC